MNLLEDFATLGINTNVLNEKKQQTTKKIEYIREYVLRWSLISAERENVHSIHFIDCMCNAGVYRDGDCCTVIEVLKIFADLCLKHPDKAFCVHCNDFDKEKIEILRKIVSKVVPIKIENLYVYIKNKDVNEYLVELNKNEFIDGRYVFGYGSSTVLYVDPFDFGTVEISKISDILKRHYCELLFNFFISDYVRNIKNDKGRIVKCLGGNQISTKDELIRYIKEQFKTGNINYTFAYQFRTISNLELYQIIFATPSVKGLEVLKETLWKVFNGSQFYRNTADTKQISLFTADDEKMISLKTYSKEAIDLLKTLYNGEEIEFAVIEAVLIENTMLSGSQIIKNVIKPMMEEGTMIKLGKVRSNNYKKDTYIIKREGSRNDKKIIDL